MASMSKKRKVLSIEEKGLIIARLESGESNATVATEFDLSHSSVSTILKNKDKIKEAFNENLLGKKKLKLSQHPDIDQALLKWFKSQRSRGTPISGPILQAKANDFGRIMGKVDFKCSESWIKRFRQRHKIVFGKISGEAASVPQGVRENWLTTVWPEIRKGYKDDEIYNADETGLFYKLTPDKTLKFKGETCTGGKLSKERITVLVATNMTGSDKPKLIVIGKSRNPRCFKHIKKLPVVYKSNKKAWMTSDLFVSILREWDAKLVKTKKKILLLVDNCPAHPKIDNLKNIKLEFLPANTTSVLQPIDQGIIRSLKVHFKKFHLMKIIENAEQGKECCINLLDAVSMIAKAWDRVSSKTIGNCFRHGGFVESEDVRNDSFDEEDDIPLARLINVNFEEEDEVPLAVIKKSAALSDDQWTEFLHAEDSLEVCDNLNEEQIVDDILSFSQDKEEREDEGSEGEEFQPPSAAEALQATNTIKKFVLYNYSSDEILVNHVNNLEKKIEFIYYDTRTKKQSKITDYFKS